MSNSKMPRTLTFNTLSDSCTSQFGHSVVLKDWRGDNEREGSISIHQLDFIKLAKPRIMTKIYLSSLNQRL